MSGETFGQALRRWRKLRGHSLRSLGALINYSHVYIWEIEHDRKAPLPEFVTACDRGLGTGGQLITTAARNREAPTVEPDLGERGLEFPVAWAEGIDIVTTLWQHDAQRRRFLRTMAFAASAFAIPIQRWLETPEQQSPDDDAGAEAPTTETVRGMTRTFRRLDNLYGGSHIRAALVQYLDADVAPVLRAGSPQTLGRGFLGAVAEATQLAGWLAYDSCDHGVGQRFFIQALGLAKTAQDRALGAEILAGMSHQAIFLKKPRPAIELAHAAWQTATRAQVPALVAEASIMKAHAFAMLGNEPGCAAALNEAETVLAGAERDNDPHWISYLDEAYLAAIAGHCFRLLGHTQSAERFARRSLDMHPGYVRGRLFNTLLLAGVHVHDRQIDQACAVGHRALDLANTVSSGRAVAQVDNLIYDLQPWRAQPAVKELTERAKLVTAQN